MPDHFIAFWNVENLFDISTSTDRPDWLKKELKSELKGWTTAVLNKKLTQLATIIRQMNGGAGPDILGLCEIENEPVLTKLLAKLLPLGRAYEIAHADTSDQRGIDVAFIYDSAKFTKGLQFQHFVQKRTATRDIFQVNFTTQAGRDLVLIGNHWPSRIPDQIATEPYRIMVGETLAYFHKRILEIMGRDTAVIAMGDFNDEPFDRAVRNYGLAVRNRQRVMNATKTDYFLNLMWPLIGNGEASYQFGPRPNMLDQFWASRGIVKSGTPFSVADDSVQVLRLAEMVSSGDYKGPRRFGRPSKSTGFDDTGYSDHFPIALILSEAP